MRRRKFKVGHAFLEHIHTEHSFFFKQQKDYSEKKRVHMRIVVLPLCLLLVVLVLAGKLFFLQIMQGVYYRNISDTNRLRTTIVHAPRGVIFDRSGNPLVFNTPGFRETINGKTTVLSSEEAIPLLARGDKHLEIDSLRKYPLKEVTGHILGFTGEISAEQLKNPAFMKYHIGDLVGQTGIERFYEAQLKGTDGKKLIEVDATGKTVRTMGQTDPIPGANITLTLDSDLQKKVFTAMSGVKKGAALVSTPTGEILSMVSRPSFDANLFTLGKNYLADGRYKNVAEVLGDDANQPLLNRAIAGTYPPGSTFKIVVAGSALENHVIDDHFTVNDTGVLRIGDFSFANWYYTQYGKTDGMVDVVKAIKRSNDIFFYTIGAKLGVNRLSAFARQFGLGEQLGIDLPGEAKGLVPTREWKKRIVGEDWFTGDDYHYGIGQGYLLTTPLQVNAWTQAIANGGALYKPRLLKGERLKVKSEKLLTKKNFELIREGMMEACSPGGVAWPLFKLKIKNEKLKIDNKNFLSISEATNSADLKNYREVSIACKTGTAQHGNDQALPHAWITLFAPAYNPEIVVTVLSEDSGEGSNIAAPIAKDILTAWFERENQK